MATFAGFLSRAGNVAPYVHDFLSSLPPDSHGLLHVAYVRADGRTGSFCAPRERVAALLPQAQVALISRSAMTENTSEAPPVFAAIDVSSQQHERSHFALEATLLARIGGVYLRRGLDNEAALARTLDKFPAAMSTIFLLPNDGAPTLVATRRGPPVWLCVRDSHYAIFAAPENPLASGSDSRPIQLGDTVVVNSERLSIVDVDGMRIEKVSVLQCADPEPLAATAKA